MDAGGGSRNQDGRRDRTPPDEQQIRLGRAKLTRGSGSGDEGGLIGGSSPAGGSFGSDPASDQIGGQPGVGGDSIDLAPRFRPWSEPAAAGTGPVRCHFLRTVGADGRLLDAQRTAVPTHRCAAFGDPLPLSLRQQELVCLQRVHVSCPRYVRGTLLASENQETVVQEQTRQPVPVLSIVGIGLVVLAIVVGGSAAMGLGPFKGKPGPTIPMVLVSPTPTSATASPTIAVTASPSAAPSATASAQPSATATASATPSASPTPAASATWPPGATASRMNLLVPCTGQANCWVYTVRDGSAPPVGNGSGSPDTVINIARFFGVTTADIYDLNPWARSGIKAGDKLKVPPPTR